MICLQNLILSMSRISSGRQLLVCFGLNNLVTWQALYALVGCQGLIGWAAYRACSETC